MYIQITTRFYQIYTATSYYIANIRRVSICLANKPDRYQAQFFSCCDFIDQFPRARMAGKYEHGLPATLLQTCTYRFGLH